VASNPAVAPDVIDNNGPEEGEFNWDAIHQQNLLHQRDLLPIRDFAPS